MKLNGGVNISVWIDDPVTGGILELSYKMPLEVWNGQIEELSLYLANTEGIEKRTFTRDPVDVLQMDLYKFLWNALDDSPALQDLIRRKYDEDAREATPAQMDQVDRQLAKMAAKYRTSEEDKLWGESYRDFITVAPLGVKP